MLINTSLHILLKEALSREASDLHLMAGLPPSIRLHGDIEFLAYDPIPADELRKMLLSLVNEVQAEKLERERDLNFSFQVTDLGRFRASLYYQRGNLEASLRVVPLRTRTLEELGLPPAVRDLALRPAGLVLIAGPTGVGKTTVMNSMVDMINSERRSRIITIEDPIEFLHTNKRSVVIQRELESDTYSFHSALLAALRQDPNVVCVGELRHMDTVSTALQAAETGHLVMATLHTQSAPQTVDRIVDVFPSHQQNQVRMQLAGSLQGVICLQLLPTMGERGRVMAHEILVATGGIRNMIRQGKNEQIANAIHMGSDDGMIGMDRCLRNLYEKGAISYDTAVSRAHNPAEFRQLRAGA
ncbi:MAG: PilT/PilU family type 4a pilus ATPase [Candidatus Eremiobacterota bacterium]